MASIYNDITTLHETDVMVAGVLLHSFLLLAAWHCDVLFLWSPGSPFGALECESDKLCAAGAELFGLINF